MANNLTDKIAYKFQKILRLNAETIKIFGPLRSGTNYAEKLIFKNLNVKIAAPEEFGWKHDFRDLKIFYKIYVMREPIDWVISYFSWERMHGRLRVESPVDFLFEPIQHDMITKRFGEITPVEYWNKFYQISQAENHTVFFMHQILEDPGFFINKVKDLYGFTSRYTSFQNLSYKADWWSKPSFALELNKQEREYWTANLNAYKKSFKINDE
tara:strand:+ start:2349 stop:2984 length:636 start_codon:yes stop_codon:yes gene_type:complete